MAQGISSTASQTTSIVVYAGDLEEDWAWVARRVVGVRTERKATPGGRSSETDGLRIFGPALSLGQRSLLQPTLRRRGSVDGVDAGDV